jgi:regulator of protease activity HflC (stomatin/prohibitin superfamily)
MIRHIRIEAHQLGLLFRDGAFQRILESGRHWIVDPLSRVRVMVVSTRAVVFTHDQIDEIIDSGQLKNRAIPLDLRDYQRALVWVDGRFDHILPAGSYALWTVSRKVRVEVVDARETRFRHEDFAVIARRNSNGLLDICEVQRDHAGVLFIDGRYVETLWPGRYGFWQNLADSRVVEIDMREQALDVSGQELMTSDKVTLRLNAALTFRVTDPQRTVSASGQFEQALYRAAQMALREVVGRHELDAFLGDKNALALQVHQQLTSRAAELGVEVIQLGIRDIILPGDMKELMNRVTEAKTAAEANLIARREETAAMRSQANTARLLEANPMLMRLRELEVLEKVAGSTNLRINLGEGGLTEQLSRLV